jgi:hypothetical protein
MVERSSRSMYREYGRFPREAPRAQFMNNWGAEDLPRQTREEACVPNTRRAFRGSIMQS